jgi:hypothetical protein
MYEFSLNPTGRKVVPDTAPPPPAHVIRAPFEISQEQQSQRVFSPPPSSRVANKRGAHTAQPQHQRSAAGASSLLETSASATPPPPPSTTSPTSLHHHPPLQVHNVSAYTDMRDAADWSAAIQRERADKRRRALAAHEAAKAAEQQRREAAEAQSKRELQHRKEERLQLRKAMKEEDEIADLQDRSTQLLKNQQRLIHLGASVAHAEMQRKTRAREGMYSTWTTTHAGTSTSSSAAMMTATTATATLSKETELREAAQRTEDAYVRLSLAYRNEAQRSRQVAGILAAADERARTNLPSSELRNGLATPLTSNTTATSTAPRPFRPAPQMYSHNSAAHMGKYAHDIPITYIPEYFDKKDRGTSPHATSTAAAAALLSTSSSPIQELMPLPLRPAPVNQEVSNALRDVYYPWAALTDARIASTTPTRPPRESYLPVRKWGEADLQASMYGHGANPDGTMQEPCERRKEFAAQLNYSTIPRDNATATSNSPQSIEPFRPGKRQEVWL